MKHSEDLGEPCRVPNFYISKCRPGGQVVTAPDLHFDVLSLGRRFNPGSEHSTLLEIKHFLQNTFFTVLKGLLATLEAKNITERH